MQQSIKTGDVLAIEGKTPLSALIRAFDNGKFSHVGIAYVTEQGVKIIEAIPPAGVVVSDLKTHYKGCRVTAFRSGLVGIDGLAVANVALGFIGVDYEETELIRAAEGKADDGDNKDGLVCSQLVAASYKAVGVDLLPNEHGFHTPNSVVKGLQKVCEVQL